MPVWKRSQGRIWSCYCIPKFWASYLYMQVIHHFINSKHILKISHFTLFEFWFHLSYYVRVIFYLKKCKCWWREVKVTPSCLTLCDPMDYTVQGILPARILEWVVAFSFSRESSQPRNQTEVSCITGRFFTSWATKKAYKCWSHWVSWHMGVIQVYT